MKKYKLKLNYTEEELKELKKLGEDCNSPMTAVNKIVRAKVCNNPLISLWKKYRTLDNHKDFDFMADVNNVIMGTAIFPNKLYIVHDTNTNSVIYHDDINNKLIWAPLCFYRPVKRTKEEWLEINPAYEPMLEKVEN